MEESDSITVIEPIASTSNQSITPTNELTSSNNSKTTTKPSNNVIEEESITYPPLPPPIAETIDDEEVITEVPLEVEEDETTMTDGLIVRARVVSRILISLNQLSSARTRTLIFTTFIAFSQIITFIIMLSISSHNKEVCSQPLKLYIILATIRIGINYPLSLYISLVPPRPSRRATELERERLRASRRIGSESTDRKIRRLSDLLSLGSLILFILGNYWIFSSNSCELTAPKLFYTTITALVISYLYAAEISLIVIAVLFFLPLLLIILRIFGVGEKTNEIGPLSQLEISKLPIRIYIPSPTLDTSLEEVSSDLQIDGELQLPVSTSINIPPPSPTTTITTKKSNSQGPTRFWRLFKKRMRTIGSNSNSNSKSTNKSKIGGEENLNEYYKPPNSTFVILSESQSTCAICLCDYDPPPKLSSPEANSTYEPEYLRLLPCSHTFHKACLDSWLKVSGRCPLCQASALVKKGGAGGKNTRGGRGGNGEGGGGGEGDAAAIV